MSKIHIYLVPGFFGFVRLGAINYFHRVTDALDVSLKKRGIDAKIISCGTQPSGSIKNQAERLMKEVVDNDGLNADQIHFIGHSTGGLNARLLVTPGVQLHDSRMEEKIGAKTRSIVTLATPHYGTPLASFFTSFQGRRILQIITTLATTTQGRRSIFFASQVLSAVARIDDVIGRDDTVLDKLANQLLRKLTLDPNDPVWQFLYDMSQDQGAIVQLTPESMHIFNAAVLQRPDVTYRCLLTAAPAPKLFNPSNFESINVASMSMLFDFLYRLTSRAHQHYPYPQFSEETARLGSSQLPFPITAKSNDGIVPTMSQVSGTPIDVVLGDHLDIVGQFRNAGGNPHGDWLPSKSQFDEERFIAVWESVAEAIAQTTG